MDMMNEIGKKAVKTYHCALKGAGKIAREIKLKTVEAQNKAKIEELYDEIGKYVYEKYLMGDRIEIEHELLHHCKLIDIIANEVEDIRKELLQLNELKQCPECHYEIDVECSYCPNCGKKQGESIKSQNEVSSAHIMTTDEGDTNLKMQN